MHVRFKKILARAISLSLMFSIVLGGAYHPYTPTASVDEVHAGGGIVYDPTNWIQNALSAARELISNALLSSLQIKEYVLDGIAFAIINMMIQQMSNDIISWINSGFQGDPAFVRNFDSFLTGIGDRAVGEFIGGTELGQYLCSPFRIQIQYALELQYTATRNFGAPSNSCTLSGIEQNIQNFMNGNFIAGSWSDWFRITQNPQYNAHGAMLMAQEKLSMNMANAKSQQTNQLGWGDGMMSAQECVQTIYNNDGTTECLEYRTVTPGTAIEDSLNEALAAPGQRIQVADEINEIFAALFNQLVTQAFSGVGGLLGLTGSGGSAPTNPYYTNLYSQPSGSSNTDLGSLIARAIATETQYRTHQETMRNMLLNAANYKENKYPGDSCHSGQLSPELQNQLNIAKDSIANANLALTELYAIQAQYQAAGTDPDLIRAVQQRFIEFQSSGTLHSDAENNTIQMLGIPALKDAIDGFIEEIEDACPTGFSGGSDTGSGDGSGSGGSDGGGGGGDGL